MRLWKFLGVSLEFGLYTIGNGESWQSFKQGFFFFLDRIFDGYWRIMSWREQVQKQESY